MSGPSLIGNALTRDLVAAALRSVADEVCRDHYHRITQEPQLTPRIGQALEDRLQHLHVIGYDVQVITQDIPDRGPHAMESRLGPDLYVGMLVRTRFGAVSKGFLAQAKWEGSLSRSERSDLDDKCERMLARTSSSYVWVYTPDGIRTLNAQTVRSRSIRKTAGGQHLDELFGNVLLCVEGDEHIGLALDANPKKELGRMLERLAAPTGFAVSVKSID